MIHLKRKYLLDKQTIVLTLSQNFTFKDNEPLGLCTQYTQEVQCFRMHLDKYQVILRVPVLSRFSHVQLFVTLWTVAHQDPLSMGFPRQEYWNGLPFPSSGNLPHPGIEPVSLCDSCIGRWVLYH